MTSRAKGAEEIDMSGLNMDINAEDYILISRKIYTSPNPCQNDSLNTILYDSYTLKCCQCDDRPWVRWRRGVI